MSKTKKTGAIHYEVLFIIPNKFTDDEAKNITNHIKKILTDNEAQVTLYEYWGKKRLAYQIKHNFFGYYGLFEFDLERSYLAKVNKDLRLSTEVLRHQIVVKKLKTEEELAREKKIQAKIDSKKASEEKKSKEKNKDLSSSKIPQKPDDKRANLKDLDKKMESILNAKDLI
jgi:small subunit ribosomal protein S6